MESDLQRLSLLDDDDDGTEYQVHDLPTGFMTPTVGQSLGNFIGEFLEYDPNNNSSL